MTPTPIPVEVGNLVVAAVAVVSTAPILLVLLAAAGIVGLAFRMSKRGRKAVR